jgi:hypothetical protein
MHSISHTASVDPLSTLLPEERLRTLGIDLPPAAAAVGDLPRRSRPETC